MLDDVGSGHRIRRDEVKEGNAMHDDERYAWPEAEVWTDKFLSVLWPVLLTVLLLLFAVNAVSFL